MSGHSKWKKIQHKKGATDAKRSNMFSKFAKEIFVAAKSGDTNPDNNATLRLAIEKAKSQSMPKENILRAIERAKGAKDGDNYDEIVYEGYGPNGVAIMLYCLTDNRNRTASFVKSTFSKRGGNLGADGSVSYMFARRGILFIETKFLKINEEEFQLQILDLEVEDITEKDGVIEIYTSPDHYEEIKTFIDENKLVSEYLCSEITMIPTMVVDVEELEVEKIRSLIDFLEENDDIQDVFHNANI